MVTWLIPAGSDLHPRGDLGCHSCTRVNVGVDAGEGEHERILGMMIGFRE